MYNLLNMFEYEFINEYDTGFQYLNCVFLVDVNLEGRYERNVIKKGTKVDIVEIDLWKGTMLIYPSQLEPPKFCLEFSFKFTKLQETL